MAMGGLNDDVAAKRKVEDSVWELQPRQKCRDLFIRARKAQENRHFQTIQLMLWYKFGTQSL